MVFYRNTSLFTNQKFGLWKTTEIKAKAAKAEIRASKAATWATKVANRVAIWVTSAASKVDNNLPATRAVWVTKAAIWATRAAARTTLPVPEDRMMIKTAAAETAKRL